MKTKHILIVLSLSLFGVNLFGHDQNVHQAITANAAASAYANSPAFEGFINVISSDGRLLKDATNSMVIGSWASISNCVGVNYYGEFYTYAYQHNLNTSNIWSWPNARYYEWLGLTATNQIQRQTNLDNMFRAVGQVMHLLQDTSQPQHVRNDVKTREVLEEIEMVS